MNEEFSSVTRGKIFLPSRVIASEEELCFIELVQNSLISMVLPIKFKKCLHYVNSPGMTSDRWNGHKGSETNHR